MQNSVMARQAGTGSDADWEQQWRTTVARLAEDFGDKVPQRTIEAYATEAVRMFEGARVRQYIRILPYRAARDRLQGLT